MTMEALKAEAEAMPAWMKSLSTFDPMAGSQPWPAVDPGRVPVGNKILVQYKQVPRLTKGGIIRPDETRDADQRANVTAKVVALGQACFQELATGKTWPGAPWYGVGDFVRVPLLGADDFWVDDVRFAFMAEEHVIAKVTDLKEIG